MDGTSKATACRFARFFAAMRASSFLRVTIWEKPWPWSVSSVTNATVPSIGRVVVVVWWHGMAGQERARVHEEAGPPVFVFAHGWMSSGYQLLAIAHVWRPKYPGLPGSSVWRE